MSLLIKGIEMPKPKLADMTTVYHAYFLVRQNGHASIVVDDEDALDSTEYTLVPVPPHGKLVDADAICEGRVSNDNVVICLKCAPTIIPADKEDN